MGCEEYYERFSTEARCFRFLRKVKYGAKVILRRHYDPIHFDFLCAVKRAKFENVSKIGPDHLYLNLALWE